MIELLEDPRGGITHIIHLYLLELFHYALDHVVGQHIVYHVLDGGSHVADYVFFAKVEAELVRTSDPLCVSASHR